ncbi:MAG TPA: hypothetical protein DEA08_22660, partial [Planctomycetes bacterium]|nr:hypothetical protein [Planctomycetota bacterium]
MPLRLSLLLSLSLLGFLCASAAAAPPRVRIERATTLRERPADLGAPRLRLAEGEHYPALDRRGAWVEVQVGPQRGWVPASHTRGSSLAASVVVADRLNLRDGPGGARLGELEQDTWLVERERREGWVRLDLGGRSGWVHAGYLLPAEASSEARAEAFLRRARREGSRASHLAYLDRGLERSPWRSEATQVAARLARGLRLAPPAGLAQAPAFPALGALPSAIAPARLDHAAQLCLVRVTRAAAGLRARWRGQDPYAQDQCWSATKQLQALGLIQRLHAREPSLRVGDLRLRDRSGTSHRLSDLFRAIVSYERGVSFSNAASGALGRLRRRSEREDDLAAWTGHRSDFRGDYGAAPLAERPSLEDATGRRVWTGPASDDPRGPNLVSTYDLTRTLAMLAWHRGLAAEQRIPAAQWSGLAPLVEALAHDPARYLDVALVQLGLADRLRDVVILSKLGHGVRSATGLAEIAYVALLQAHDAWTGRD